MAKKPQHHQSQPIVRLPRIIADFGGRRRILDRRATFPKDEKKERRSGKERRCGFDRRNILNPLNESAPERRNTDSQNNDADPESSH